jgi:SAM-dependent methyltransferase
VLGNARRRQTLASFDYQWGHLPEGDAMLSDPWFADHVDQIVAEELVGIDRRWFAGRAVLDAGCGAGRWTLGLLRLGCRVTAVDFSAHGLAAARAQMERLAPDAVASGRLETVQADLLALPEQLASRRFDLVFSFGVLHHTGDTHGALASVAGLVAPDGVLFVYLYGRASAPAWARTMVNAIRFGLAPLPFSAKRAVLSRLLPSRDPHQAFDLLSPTINETLPRETVASWLQELGFGTVTTTLPHTDMFLRAARPSAEIPSLPPPTPPYWFERYRRRS